MFGKLRATLRETVNRFVKRGEVDEGAKKKPITGEFTPDESSKRKVETPLRPKRGLLKRIAEKQLDVKDVDKFVKELERTLMENDVALKTAEKICGDVKESLVGESVSRGKIEKIVNASLRESILSVLKEGKLEITRKPFTILFLGFNGSGKTTSLARIANMLLKDGKKCVLAGADTFRAASIEQLQEHANNLGIKMIKHDYGSDPAAVVYDAKKYAAAKNIDVVLCDTAGRSHTNINLMDELKKIVRVNKPDMKLLVIDALTGNDVYEQAKLFDEAVGVDGIILTKTDVYEKGGAALSASHTIGKPVLFIGTGQGYDDIEEFRAEKIVDGLLG
jgi:fused signal recognition particle receptor